MKCDNLGKLLYFYLKVLCLKHIIYPPQKKNPWICFNILNTKAWGMIKLQKLIQFVTEIPNRNFQLPGGSWAVQTTRILISDVWCFCGEKIFMISLLPTSYLKIVLFSWHHDIHCLAFSVSFLKLFDDHHTIPLPHLGPRGRHFASHRPLERWKSAVLDISVADSQGGGGVYHGLVGAFLKE